MSRNKPRIKLITEPGKQEKTEVEDLQTKQMKEKHERLEKLSIIKVDFEALRAQREKKQNRFAASL